MSRAVTARWLSACVLVLGAGAKASAATPKEVDDAIKKATAYLIANENANGNWETVQKPDPKAGNADVTGKQWGGLTAIATYALLAAGTEPQDKALEKPIAFLKAANLEGIYATGLRCQVWLLLDDPKKLGPYLARDESTLLNAVHLNSGTQDSIGFYPYFYVPRQALDAWYDRSVSQYGVLGLWALAEAGVEIPTKYWVIVNNAWEKAQHADGGWNYNAGAKPESTAPMTAAGIATLFITQDFTLGNIAECRGNVTNRNIEAGLAWMDKNIHSAIGGNYYGMYGIERIGVASGRKYFETVDWYKDGAEFIVRNQAADGHWGGGIADTCFAILFLARGRSPIIMNKLQYTTLEKNGKSIEGPWNERPRDCANFAYWMGHQIEEHHLNWQTVNLKVAPEELHDSQILYLSGNKELNFSNGDIAKLRTFVEQGGMILGNADCEQNLFNKSFKELGNKMFPKYEFRDLPESHIIFEEQFPATKWRPRPKVAGLSNGVRELMLLIPQADVGRAWQSRNEKTRSELFQLGADIYLYSVDKKFKHKGESYIIAENPQVQTTRAVTVGRLQVGDNWNPEPAGWPRLGALLHNEQKVALTVKDVKLDPADLKGLKVLHLTGTTQFVLNEEKRKTLKDFVTGGGTLIIDAAGGNTAFANSAETELKAIFGENPKPLPKNSPVYSLPGATVDAVGYRNFAIRNIVGGLNGPRVKAIEIKGRFAVLYSREDLSAGIVGEPMDGIIGYDPATATLIMRNLVLYAAFGLPQPATQPSTKPATYPTTQPASAPATQPAAAPATQPAK